ncbi:hypothetical protein [Deinococcus planocerae]|uniref:hypothetical protein n=1 Tax=Deinococcus planocerae TaxID=1737569 RepID=UPI0011AF9A66|nr:hypothetical protein [Deinococcus planocerae]
MQVQLLSESDSRLLTQLGLVVSTQDYQQTTYGAFVALVTSASTGYPFEVALTGGFSGRVVLADYITRYSFSHCEMAFVEAVPGQIVNQVLGKIEAILRL